MKRPKHGATLKQYAFAQKLMNADGKTKRDIALSVGYSRGVANNTYKNIEETEGYQNAIIALAHESNNLVMAAMAEYKARGLNNFSNKDLNAAMNAIATAWDKINKKREPSQENARNNPLKAIFIERHKGEKATVTDVEPEVSEEDATASNPLDDDDEL